jgi:hypothetical protein
MRGVTSNYPPKGGVMGYCLIPSSLIGVSFPIDMVMWLMIDAHLVDCLGLRGGCRVLVVFRIYWMSIWSLYRMIIVRPSLILMAAELIADDHLDKATILDIERYHQNIQYLVPNGVKAILVSFGVDLTRVKELGWWDETTITTSPEYLPKEHQIDVTIPSPTFESSDNDPPLSPTSTLFSQATLTNDTSITATCCPAQHNSGRGLFHRNETLWASWYLTCTLPDGGEYKVYFGG